MNAFMMYRMSKTPPKNPEGCEFFQYPDGNYVIATDVWACGNCFSVHHYKDKAVAEQCCVCTYCGKPVEAAFPPKTYHEECLRASLDAFHKKHEESYEVILPENIDWERSMAIFGETETFIIDNPMDAYDYFKDSEEKEEVSEGYQNLLEKDYWDGTGLDWLFDEANDFCEDGADHLDGVEELETALAQFNETNKGFYRWLDVKKRFSIPAFIAWYEKEFPSEVGHK